MIIKVLSLYLFVGILLLSGIFAYSTIKLKPGYAKALGVFSCLLCVYLLGYMMEINASTLADMYFWNQVQYFAIPFLPASWFAISLLYTGRVKTLWSWTGAMIFIIPVVTFILRFTNEYHNLYYSGVMLQEFDGMKFLMLLKGPWYNIQLLYALAIFIFSTWFYFQKYSKSSSDRNQFKIIVIESLGPYFGIVLNSINFRGIGIDYTAIVLPISCILIYYSIAKYDFLELKILAWERVFRDNNNGLVLLNGDLLVMDYNSTSERFSELMGTKMELESLYEIFAHDDIILDCIHEKSSKTIKIDHSGTTYYLSVSIQDIKNSKVNVGMLLVFEDVTSREQTNQKLFELATIDSLSQLANRRHFMEISKKELLRANRNHKNFAVAMMDIDDFKRINDTYGHSCGDMVISTISNILKSSYGETDIIGRVGGEEFAVAMLYSRQTEVYEKLEEFRKIVKNHKFEYRGENFSVTISIGVSNHNFSESDMEVLLSEADDALYESKQNGKNRTSEYLK